MNKPNPVVYAPKSCITPIFTVNRCSFWFVTNDAPWYNNCIWV